MTGNQIVIAHGTDTMTKTAEILAKEDIKKTIVFTGAMIPYAFGSSDGLFNFGTALTAAQILPHGIYIAMDGRFFQWDKVKKIVIRAYLKKYLTSHYIYEE